MNDCEYDGENTRSAAESVGGDGDGHADAEATDEPLPATTMDRMQGFLDEHGYLSWLGVTLQTASHGRAVLTTAHCAELTDHGSRNAPRTHGDIPVALIDTASGFALRTTFDDPARTALTTTDLDVSYLRPATADLRVEAKVIRAGDTVGVTRATVTSVAPDGNRREVAIGATTYRLFHDRNAGDADPATDADSNEDGNR